MVDGILSSTVSGIRHATLTTSRLNLRCSKLGRNLGSAPSNETGDGIVSEGEAECLRTANLDIDPYDRLIVNIIYHPRDLNLNLIGRFQKNFSRHYQHHINRRLHLNPKSRNFAAMAKDPLQARYFTRDGLAKDN